MKVVVTGATGAIGIALLKILIEEQIETLVLLHRGSQRNEAIPESKYIRKEYCDLNEMSQFELENKYDIFFHMAWSGGRVRENIVLQNANVTYALDAVRLASRLGCKRFVGMGSQAEYGLHKEKLRSETSCNPINPFAASKLYAGYMTRFLAEQLEIEHIWCRILSVYGPCDGSETMVSVVIKKMLEGNSPSLTACHQVWDYIYSEDAARAIFLVGLNGKNGKVYPIGSGEERPLREYVMDIRDAINPSLQIAFGEMPYCNNQVMYLSADLTEIFNDTGFTPMVSFAEGIRRTIQWMKKR